MKLLPQVKQVFTLIFLTGITHIAVAQTKLIVNGVKVNLADGVYLSTNDLSATANSSVNVAQSTIKIAGSTASTGSIDARNGTVELNGSAAQQIAAAAFATKTIKALTINNTPGATVNDTLNITDVLTVASGKLISGGFLTLKSSDTATARVAPVTSVDAVPISGNVIVERFITSKRAFRFLTAPVNSATTIRENWMEGVNNPNTTAGNVNPVPDYGTHITGTGGHLNNFDETITNNSSLFTWDYTRQVWNAEKNPDSLFRAGNGYSILVRGSRSTYLNSNTPPSSPTTLRAKGALVTGTADLKAAGAGGTPGMATLSAAPGAYSFIANPYASPVDWLLISTTDISNTIYIFDATINGANGRGGYVSFNRTYNATGNNNAASQVDNNIQSGQAFFVQTTGPNPLVSFREPYKTNVHRAVFRAPETLPKLSLQLLIVDKETGKRSADGLSAYFSNKFSSAFGDEDSYKFTNEDENISILRNGKTLSIEGRQPVTADDTIPLKMWHITLKNYALKIVLKNFDDNITSYLEDNFLHTAARLNNEALTEIPFTITEDSLSAAPGRFRIVFKNAGTLLSSQPGIGVYAKDKGVQVEWTTGSAGNTDSCIIEKAENAQHFVAIGAVKTKDAAANTAYQWFDANPAEGDNFYRIKLVNPSAQANYTRIGKVHFEAIKGTISVVSNESNSNDFAMNFKNIEKGKYVLGLINNAGQKVYSSTIIHPGGSASYAVKPKNVLAAGIYHLQVSGNNKLKNIPVLIQ